MIPAFEGLFNCLINGYIKSHLKTVFVQYSKTTLNVCTTSVAKGEVGPVKLV